MSKSVYSEVTAVSTSGFERDRVLDKLKTPATGLPFSLEDIKISHNDFAVADVYNDSIRKLYSNYLFLIANAELTTKTSPVTGNLGYWAFNDTFTPEKFSVTTNPVTGTSTSLLSSTKETHIIKKTYTNDSNNYFLYFNYSPAQSIIFDSNTTLSSPNALLSGNFVEFNKTFKFKNIVSVDTVGNLLFVLDKELNTAFKFDITGLITNDPALKRTGINDITHPGRYLLKTIGGGGISQTKNKLKAPSSLSVHGEYVYILDNGHHSLKVFDLDFNFIKEVKSTPLFNNANTGRLVSIVVDKKSDTSDQPVGYILTHLGKIIEYDVQNNTVGSPHSPFDIYDTRMQSVCSFYEDENFSKIINSKSSKNILYACNNKNIFKFYKTNFNLPLAVFDFTVPNFTVTTLSANKILSFDSTLHHDVDYLAVTTTPLSAHGPSGRISPTVTYVFADKNITTKLYNESFYTNYFSLSDILVLPQEVVSNITFNKTTKKLIYNHFSFFENLSKKVYSYYNNIDGTFLTPTLCTVNYKAFDKPSSFIVDDNFYIGVNEPILTDIINRPLTLLYNQQEDLFNLIKEESLNDDPPVEWPARLPGKFESSINALSITPSISTASSGDVFDIEIKRTNELGLDNECSFYYYTNVEDPTVTDDISPYISGLDKSYAVIGKNLASTIVSIAATPFHVGTDKTFTFLIEQKNNCVIDPEKSTFTGTMTAIGSLYTINLEETTFSVSEGKTVRVNVIRSNPDDDFTEESICNLYINPVGLPETDYVPNVSHPDEFVPYQYVEDEFSDFGRVPHQWPAGQGHAPTVDGQTFANELSATSTLHFTEGVSSIVFDLSAVYNLTENKSTRLLKLHLLNASETSELGSNDSGIITVNDNFKTINLFLSSISAISDTGTTNMLSCVNVWEALSASTKTTNTNAFSTISATNPIQATFTVQEPLSVFSVSTISAALQFQPPPSSFIYGNNQIEFIIEEDAALVGKGGRGGHGSLWLSGYDNFEKEIWEVPTGSNPVSASTAEASPGGPAISDFDDYFNVFTITNSGIVYGGSGGGSGGMLGVSATAMGHVSALSGGSGGGGGAGIHSTNVGSYGLAAVQDMEADTFTQHTHALDYLENGDAGTLYVGGAGGEFSETTISDLVVNDSRWLAAAITLATYPGMKGTAGGGLGEPGVSDAVPVAAGDNDSTEMVDSGVTDRWKKRTGGAAGLILETTFASNVVMAGDGEFKGTLPGPSLTFASTGEEFVP